MLNFLDPMAEESRFWSLDRYISLFKRWAELSVQSNFVHGAAPRGGWPIRPFSRSKYRPMNETVDCKPAQRRRKQMSHTI